MAIEAVMPPIQRVARQAPMMRREILVFVAIVASGCAALEPLTPAGEAHWGLAPGTVLAADTTAFVAVVTEQACASGRSSEGRLVGPEIEYTDEAVLVTFGVRPLEGGQECPSNPAATVAVTLSEPLGDRQLLDGWSDPPREPPVCVALEFCE